MECFWNTSYWCNPYLKYSFSKNSNVFIVSLYDNNLLLSFIGIWNESNLLSIYFTDSGIGFLKGCKKKPSRDLYSKFKLKVIFGNVPLKLTSKSLRQWLKVMYSVKLPTPKRYNAIGGKKVIMNSVSLLILLPLQYFKTFFLIPLNI